jgi:hypothetical protein
LYGVGAFRPDRLTGVAAMIRKLIGVCVGLAMMGVVVAPMTASATLLTWSFTGEVVGFNGDTDGNGVDLFDSSVFIGAQLTGNVTFDPATTADASPSSDVGEFYFDIPSASLVATVGNFTFQVEAGLENVLISIFDNGFSFGLLIADLVDTDGFIIGTSSSDPSFQTAGIFSYVMNGPGTAIADPNILPTTLPDLSPFFASGGGLISGVTGDPNINDPDADGITIEYRPTSLVVTPLPAALPLMGTGLTVLGLLGWRRWRAA